MTDRCPACGQHVPARPPAPCEGTDGDHRFRIRRCACGHDGLAHLASGVCMACVTVESIRHAASIASFQAAQGP